MKYDFEVQKIITNLLLGEEDHSPIISVVSYRDYLLVITERGNVYRVTLNHELLGLQ